MYSVAFPYPRDGVLYIVHGIILIAHANEPGQDLRPGHTLRLTEYFDGTTVIFGFQDIPDIKLHGHP